MWRGDTYVYNSHILQVIANAYDDIYEGIDNNSHTITNPISIAEYKADFDIALSSIGPRQWQGITSFYLSNYKGFGRLQRVIIADILKLNTIPRLRGYAYHLMCDRLNGEPHHGTRTQFKAKPQCTML